MISEGPCDTENWSSVRNKWHFKIYICSSFSFYIFRSNRSCLSVI